MEESAGQSYREGIQNIFDLQRHFCLSMRAETTDIHHRIKNCAVMV
jgi:hypothetical protein